MPAKTLPFQQTEYDNRLLMVRTSMAMAGLDAMLITDPSNQAWVTGYDGWSFYVHQGVIVTQDSDPIWWGRNQDTNGATRTVWMPDDCVIGYADNFVQSDEKHPMEDLARHLDALGVQNLGVEMDNYYFSAKAFSTLLQALPNVGFADATGLVNWQRTIKSEAEIAFMRKAALISEKIVDGLVEQVEAGIPKNDIVAEIYRDAIRGVGRRVGRLSCHCSLAPFRHRRCCPAFDVGRTPFCHGRSHVFRDLGMLSPLSRPIVSQYFPWNPPR